jgi:hypothetical protein
MGELWEPYMGAAVEALADGWSGPDIPPRALRAVLRLAVDFGSWRVLTDSGLEEGAAAGLMARMVTGAVEGAGAAGRT